MLKNASHAFFQVFTERETLMNLVYLLAGFACSLVDLILFSVSVSLLNGLVAVPLGVMRTFRLDPGSTLRVIGVSAVGALVIPVTALLCFFPALLEQRLAARLLNITFSVSSFWKARGSHLAAAAHYILSVAAWRRLLFGLVRIPLGILSFLAVLTLLPAAFGLLSMPIVYLAGFHGLIIGTWRIDSLGESLVVFLAGLIARPLTLHALNLLSRLVGWLARAWLGD